MNGMNKNVKKSVRLNNHVFIDSSSIVDGHTTLNTILNKFQIKYAHGYTLSDKNYSASSWSRPRFILENFVTNDTTIFEQSGPTGIKVLEAGNYFIIVSRETNLGTSEQDCYILYGNELKRFSSYSTSGTFILSATLNQGDIIFADCNCGATNFIIRHVTITIIKVP